MMKKLKFVPISQEGGAVPKKNFRGSPFVRNTPEYDIILKMGRIRGYDDNRRILGSDGNYVQGSDITMLLCEAMTPKRVLNGMDEFIKLLAKAKVDPDIIVNDNIKSKLTAYKSQIILDEDDNIPIPADEVARSNATRRVNTNKSIVRNQPRIGLKRLNPDDYRHLVGKGKSGVKKTLTNKTSRKKRNAA